jgi:predicted nucleic acid-binding protein
MIVVADTSPLIALINLGEIEVLPRLFNTVLIPQAVLQELGDLRRRERREEAVSVRSLRRD